MYLGQDQLIQVDKFYGNHRFVNNLDFKAEMSKLCMSVRLHSVFYTAWLINLRFGRGVLSRLDIVLADANYIMIIEIFEFWIKVLKCSSDYVNQLIFNSFYFFHLWKLKKKMF